MRAELVPALKAGGYRAVAICLLNAYANPVHEKRLATLIGEALPDVLVTCSHQVAREFREFERASTTLLSAYVQPVIDGYLHRFESRLADAGFKGRFTVMQSNGGRLPAEAMRESAITALYSGPAAGVVGATRQAARSGFRDLITFDMGGTSTDVCLVQDGRPSLASESEIDGLPIRTPVLDIVSVGAGGGSIAWVDDGGMLRVGPQSAGADPGPACYGKGGTEPTTTDAHIVIGTIRPGAFLGGAHEPRRRGGAGAPSSRWRRASASRVEQAASSGAAARRRQHRARHPARLDRARPRSARLRPGAVRRRGAAACRAHRRGARHRDHRRAAQCRRDLGLRPGRLGLHQVRRRHAQDEARRRGGRRKPAACSARCARGSPRQFADMKLPGDLVYTHTLDMRFVGQAFEVGVEIPAARLGSLDAAYLAELFADAHHRTFMHGAKLDRPVEIVTLRVGATLPIGTRARARPRDRRPAAPPEKAKIFHGEAWIDVRPLRRRGADGRPERSPAPPSSRATPPPPGCRRAGRPTLDAADNLILRRAS